MLRTLCMSAALLLSAQALASEHTIRVIAIHQLDDEPMASFDFFGAEMLHECGGKPSNRYRSYSRQSMVSERKFELVLSAFENNNRLSVDTLGCEGNSMRVGRIGIRK